VKTVLIIAVSAPLPFNRSPIRAGVDRGLTRAVAKDLAASQAALFHHAVYLTLLAARDATTPMNDRLAKLFFILGIALLAFIYGIGVGHLRLFPYYWLEKPLSAARQWVNEGMQKNFNNFRYPRRYPQTGTVRSHPQSIQPGVTLVTSMFARDEGYGPEARLLSMDGEVLHRWVVYPEQLFPDPPHQDYVSGLFNHPENYIHGSWLLPNGDLVFNVEYLGLFRIDACSRVIWRLPFRTHHSVFRDEDGQFWVPGLRWRQQPNPEYMHVRPPFVDEVVLKVSPDGQILEEIGLLQALYRSGMESVMAHAVTTLDFTHTNDVEVLSRALAADFPSFSAGDVLVSMRNLGLVFVLDANSHLVKWHMRMPLIHQHDPDFEPGGMISIFDNRADRTPAGTRLGGSRILGVDPASNAWRVVYPTEGAPPFYTELGGKHQRLPNGNRLITESNTGRVFEVDESGKTVWSWINPSIDGQWVAEVLEGTRYPETFADFLPRDCGR